MLIKFVISLLLCLSTVYSQYGWDDDDFYVPGVMYVNITSVTDSLIILQTSDGNALMIYGYDDRSSSYYKVNINSLGETHMYSSGNMFLNSNADIVLNSGNVVLVSLGDNAGVDDFRVLDLAKNTVFEVNSDGNGYFAGVVAIGGVAINANIDLFIDRDFSITGGSTGGFIRAAGHPTLGSTSSFHGLRLDVDQVTAFATGTHDKVIGISVDAFTVNNTGADITTLAAFYIQDAPTFAGTATNGPYALFIDDGDSRFDGGVIINSFIDFNSVSAGAETAIEAVVDLSQLQGAVMNSQLPSGISRTTIYASNWVHSYQPFRSAGLVGLSATYNFGGGGVGDIATMTFTGGILTGVTTVP